MATRGFAAPEVEHAYARARELCLQMGDTPQLFPVLNGLYRFYLIRAQLQTARELGAQLLTVAQSSDDPALLLPAHRALGDALFWLGEGAAARVHLEQGIALYDPQQHRSLAFLYGDDPMVDCLSYRAWVLWWLGYPDQSLKSIPGALALARELAHPFSLARALAFTAWLHQYRREGQEAQERAEEAIVLSSERGFAVWLAVGTLLRGWALAEHGQGEAGIELMRQGLAAYRATGAELSRTYWLALLAEAYGHTGQTDEGLNMLAEAFALVHETGERFYEAELYRLQGELRLLPAIPDEQQAEICFRQALDIARHQQAKSLELRTAISLGRLWQRQGKTVQACRLLTEVYTWFTEGFDTVNLQEAKALLEQWT